MMSCGIYSVHTNILSSFEVTFMRGFGSGQLYPEAVVLPLGTEVKATGAVVAVAAGASVAVGTAMVGGSVGAVVGGSVAAWVGVCAPPQAVNARLAITIIASKLKAYTLLIS